MLDAVSVVSDFEEEVAQVEVNILDECLVFLFNSLLDTFVICRQVIMGRWELRHRILEVVVSVLFLVSALTSFGLFLLFLRFFSLSLVVLVELD